MANILLEECISRTSIYFKWLNLEAEFHTENSNKLLHKLRCCPSFCIDGSLVLLQFQLTSVLVTVCNRESVAMVKGIL